MCMHVHSSEGSAMEIATRQREKCEVIRRGEEGVIGKDEGAMIWAMLKLPSGHA